MRLGDWSRHVTCWLLLALALAIVAARPASAAPAPSNADRVSITLGSLTLRACSVVEVPGTQAWCGDLPRPWDPRDPAQGTFDLAFAVVLPTSGVTTEPAVVGLEGGPGYGSIDTGQYYAEMLGPLLGDRALLVMDARGTGRSDAARCPSLAREDLRWSRAVALCGQRLGPRAPLLASALAADDLAALVTALDLGVVDVYGDSYGTFLAQVVAGRHPTMVRQLVLDGAYPVLGEDAWYPTQGPAMRRSFARVCSRTPTCARLPGSTMARLRAVLDGVRGAPVSVHAPGGDGHRHRVVVDAPSLVEVAFNATYVVTTYRELDAALRAARGGDWLPLGRLVAEYDYPSPYRTPVSVFSPGQMLAVSCHDYPQLFETSASVPQRREQVAAAVGAAERERPRMYGPFTIDEYLHSSWAEQLNCVTWPGSPADPHLGPGPVSGHYPDVPTLVLSGELDTITTPAEGAMVAAQFPRSRQIVVANGLHVVALGDPAGCAATLVRSFLRDAPSALQTPASCSVPSIRLAPGYPRTSRGLTLGSALRQTVEDVIDRIWQTEASAGLGLRGGDWSYRGWPATSIELHDVRLFADLAVSGSARWNAETGRVRAELVVGGRGWHDSWDIDGR